MNDTPTEKYQIVVNSKTRTINDTCKMFVNIGFSVKESIILECLKDEQLPQNDINFITRLHQSTISQILKGLIKKGCVEICDVLVVEGRGRPTNIYACLLDKTIDYAEKQIVDNTNDIERLKQLLR